MMMIAGDGSEQKVRVMRVSEVSSVIFMVVIENSGYIEKKW